MNNFYVYLIVDKDEIPFYAGKGKGSRWKDSLSCYGHNNLKKNKIKKILKETGSLPDVVIYKDNLSEIEAFALEKELISSIGRRDLNLGPLVNMTDGGEGSSNPSKESVQNRTEKIIGRKFSSETKKKISDARNLQSPPGLGRIVSSETKIKMSKLMSEKYSNGNHPLIGTRHSEETKNKISVSNIGKQAGNKNPNFGKQRSQEVRDKISKSNAKLTYKVKSPLNEVFEFSSLTRFCKENNLNQGNMWNLCKGNYKQYKGWIAISISNRESREVNNGWK